MIEIKSLKDNFQYWLSTQCITQSQTGKMGQFIVLFVSFTWVVAQVGRQRYKTTNLDHMKNDQCLVCFMSIRNSSLFLLSNPKSKTDLK